MPPPPHDDARALQPCPTTGQHNLAERYAGVRAASERLVAPLSTEDQQAQSMPDASPTKWHLAHVTWFFETFLLTQELPGYRVFDPAYAYLFNSYYEAVGERHPRPRRGLLTRPSLADVMAYRRHVDAAMGELLALSREDLRPLIELGLAHEEQHQELILMDILHLFAQSPLKPAYSPARPNASPPGALEFIAVDGGIVDVGHEGPGFAFDNEGPRHQVLLQPFQIASRPVTNGEWLGFMEAGGYERPEYWLSDGWARVQDEGWRSPLYWERRKDGWFEMSLGGLAPLDLDAPVSHVSYYEADAYAAFAGARLPTEFEWEHASCRVNGLGQRWEWTRSAYSPYPGFQPGPGAVGEYNGKFMVGQLVLRGGCIATPAGHVRPTYRNFFYPHQRWMFSGVRLALDGGKRARRRDGESFADDVVAGLSRSPKSLPPKWFYDARGSELFEAICELPEYYLTRMETDLLRRIAPDIAAEIPAGATLVEFGSGASSKTRIILDAAPQIRAYTPIDISASALEAAAARLREDYPDLAVSPALHDFAGADAIPPLRTGPKAGFFPGSTIGNFTRDEAVRFLAHARQTLGAGGVFIVGADLVKEPEVLIAAYDDAAGVTAAFNRNLLERMKRDLGADIDPDAFRHRAVWNAAENRIEMHLESLRDQAVRVAGRTFAFSAGEMLHTENSHKFTPEAFEAMAREGGWRVARRWISPPPSMAVFLLRAA